MSAMPVAATGLKPSLRTATWPTIEPTAAVTASTTELTELEGRVAEHLLGVEREDDRHAEPEGAEDEHHEIGADERQMPPARDREPPPQPHSAAERKLVERLTRAFENSDVEAIVALLSEDVQFAMPPLEYHGRELAARFLTAVSLRRRRNRIVATRANGQPALGLYVRDPGGRIFHAMELLVLTLSGDRVCAITRFDSSVLRHFGLPRKLPG
jgi:hypothetical protein